MPEQVQTSGDTPPHFVTVCVIEPSCMPRSPEDQALFVRVAALCVTNDFLIKHRHLIKDKEVSVSEADRTITFDYTLHREQDRQQVADFMKSQWESFISKVRYYGPEMFIKGHRTMTSGGLM